MAEAGHETSGSRGGVPISRRDAPRSRVPLLAPHAESIALGLVVALVSYLSLVFGELILKSPALRFFGDSTTFTEARLSSEELQILVDDAAEQGTLEPHAGEIASRAFDFAALTREPDFRPETRSGSACLLAEITSSGSSARRDSPRFS